MSHPSNGSGASAPRWRRAAKATLRHLPRHPHPATPVGIPLGTPLVDRAPALVVDVTELARDVETHASTLAGLFLTWCPRSGMRDTTVRDLEQLAERFRVLASDAPHQETPT